MSVCKIMKRMKENYENRQRHSLICRTPVIIRLDGKAFHTYTRRLNKPFDEGLIEDMQQTAIYLCQNIQGAKCAYIQSDEISILVTDYDSLDTKAWFDYDQSKIESVSASLATGIFNQLRLFRLIEKNQHQQECQYSNAIEDWNLANFDSRAFNIPKEEVANYFYARQKDAVKNSIFMLAQSLYSHKELHGKNGSQMQEMTFQKDYNWNDLHFSKKRGSFIVCNTYWNGELVKEQSVVNKYLETEIEYFTDSIHKIENKYYDKNNNEIVPIIRNKWEIVETPLNFKHSNFEKWL